MELIGYNVKISIELLDNQIERSAHLAKTETPFQLDHLICKSVANDF